MEDERKKTGMCWEGIDVWGEWENREERRSEKKVEMLPGAFMADRRMRGGRGGGVGGGGGEEHSIWHQRSKKAHM